MGRHCRCECLVFLNLMYGVIFSANAVYVENGVYKNVLVSFSADIPTNNAEEVLRSTRESLSATSRILKKAIGVSFGDVTFLIPYSWNVSHTKNTLASHSSRIADMSVAVTAQDSAFGTHPNTLQYGGCGVPGLKINIPVDILSSNAETNARSFAKEWLKYRYGVFDEGGFPGDERFPVYSSTVGADMSDVRVTDCTNTPLRYHFKGSENANCTPIVDEKNGLPIDELCSVVPDEEDLESIESSLLYIPTLPKVEYICGTANHPHNSISSNKQNALCNGKSILEVLKNSPELQDIRIGENSDITSEPEFNVVKEINPRIVLAFDTTNNIVDKRGDTIKTSIRRLLYDLPANSKCSFIRFPDAAEVISTLDEVPNNFKDRLQLDSNLKFSFEIPSTNPCPQCALKKALDMLLEDDPTSPGSIILISSSNPTADEQVLNILKSSQLCLSVITFQGLMATFEGFRSYLEASPCGNYVEIPDSDDPLETYELLHETLLNAVLKSDSMEQSSTVLTSYIRHNSNSEPFSIGPPSKEVTLWLMPKKDLYVSAIECKTTDTSEEKRTPTSTFEPNMMLALIFQSKVNEQLTCSLKYPRDPVQMQVRSTSQPRKNFDFVTRIVDTTPVKSQDQMPVILYAKVHLGVYPILEADVKAVVTPPEGDPVSFNLLDNGIGDPDITQNDGIYSRYFTQFTVAGKYRVQISVSDNVGQAQAGTRGSDKCCGSRILLQDKISVGKFERSMKTEFEAVAGRPELGYKPSRIADLRVNSATLPRYVSLRWTAPGGEADQGKVTSYVLKLFNAPNKASERYDSLDQDLCVQKFNITENIGSYGENHIANIDLEENLPQNETYFITVQSINDKGLMSDASNVVEIFIAKEDFPVTPTGIVPSNGPDDSKESKTSGLDRKTTIIIIVTVLVIVLIIFIYLVVYFLIIKRKIAKENARKKGSLTNSGNNPIMSSVPNDKPEESELNDFDSFNSIPADVLLNHHRSVQDAKLNKRPPPIFRTENLHTSQILSNGVKNNAFDHYSEQSEDSPKSSNSGTSEGTSNMLQDKTYSTPRSSKRITAV